MQVGFSQTNILPPSLDPLLMQDVSAHALTDSVEGKVLALVPVL